MGFLIICAGILGGTFTGLLPGIHVNLIAGVILYNIVFLNQIFSNQMLVIFILVMSLTHTFISFIPSLIFGVPSADTVLSILPGHQMILEGEGFLALFLSTAGSFAGLIFTLIITPICFFLLEKFYEIYKNIVIFFLIVSIILLLLTDKNPNKIFWSIIIILFSSGTGLLVLNSKSIEYPLLVLFTGLFGVATILYSLMQSCAKLPKQNFKVDYKKNLNKEFIKSVLFGGIASVFCSITPGIGNAQAGILSTMFFKNITSKLFIVVLGAINTINFSLSIITFYLISRTRNGSIHAISQFYYDFTLDMLLLYLVILLFAGIICFFVTLILGKVIIQIVEKFNVKIINIIILVSIFIIVCFLSNWVGMLVLLMSTCLGITCLLLEVKRVHLMSVLIFPVIINLI